LKFRNVFGLKTGTVQIKILRLARSSAPSSAVATDRLTDRSVANIVKAYAGRAGSFSPVTHCAVGLSDIGGSQGRVNLQLIDVSRHSYISDIAPGAHKMRCCPNTPARQVPRDVNEYARDVALLSGSE
jgi:hypothetical protein